MKTLLSMPNNLKKIFLSGLVMFAVVTSGISQCTNTAAWSTETAPTVPNSATIYGQYAGEYGTWLSLVAGTQYVITSSIVTDYLTVRQGTPGGTAVAYGVQPLTYTATTSGTYYIHCNVSLLCDAQSAARDITMTAVSSSAPGPANEQCSGAIAVAIPSSTSGTTVGAQPEAPAPPTCITTYDNSNGVWYTVTGTGNPITASLCGSGWDSKLHVYTGSCGTFTCVTGNDDLGPACSTSDASVRWCSVSGTTYYILVSGYSTYSGAFTLTMSQLVLTPAITPTSPSVCTGNSITLTATGPGTFTWNPGSGSGANFTVSPTATTTYTCTATDAASGCTGTATVSVSVNPSPTVTVTPSSAAICAGGQTTLNAAGATTYSWMPGSLSGASVTVNPTATTTYTVTGTASGCTNTATTTITVNPVPAVIVSPASSAICAGGQTTLNATGATSYSWMPGSMTGASVTVNPTSNTTYTVTGTDAGCTNTATADVTVNPAPIVTASGSAPAVCSGDAVTLSGIGATSYSWSHGVMDGVPFNPVATETYTVTGTDAAGCTNTSTITIAVNASPVVMLSLPQDTVCSNGGVVTLSGESPAGGTWTGNGVSGTIFDPAVAGQGYAAIDYMYTDANGCSGLATDEYYVEICTGIYSQGEEVNMRLVPNPNNGEFSLLFNSSAGDMQIDISDAQGKLIYTTIENNVQQGFRKDIALELSKGIYFIRVSTNKGSTQQSFIVD